jgi:hypothetical protein
VVSKSLLCSCSNVLVSDGWAVNRMCVYDRDVLMTSEVTATCSWAYRLDTHNAEGPPSACFILFVWSGVVDGALLCGRHVVSVAPVDSRVPCDTLSV